MGFVGERLDFHEIMRLPTLPSVPTLSTAATHAAAVLLSAALAVGPPQAAIADARIVGEVQGSGLVFKDTLRVENFLDPKVKGVQLYLSDFQRPVTEKLAKGDIFSDPTNGGLSCSHRGNVVVSLSASRDKGGEEVFSEQRSLLFKSLKVRRLVDEEGGSVIYATYSQRRVHPNPLAILAWPCTGRA